MLVVMQNLRILRGFWHFDTDLWNRYCTAQLCQPSYYYSFRKRTKDCISFPIKVVISIFAWLFINVNTKFASLSFLWYFWTFVPQVDWMLRNASFRQQYYIWIVICSLLWVTCHWPFNCMKNNLAELSNRALKLISSVVNRDAIRADEKWQEAARMEWKW